MPKVRRRPVPLKFHIRRRPAIVDALIVVAVFVIFMWLWWVIFG